MNKKEFDFKDYLNWCDERKVDARSEKVYKDYMKDLEERDEYIKIKDLVKPHLEEKILADNKEAFEAVLDELIEACKNIHFVLVDRERSPEQAFLKDLL